MSDHRERLTRELDGSLYAYRCHDCGASWKVYQQETHYVGCRITDPPVADARRTEEEG